MWHGASFYVKMGAEWGQKHWFAMGRPWREKPTNPNKIGHVGEYGILVKPFRKPLWCIVLLGREVRNHAGRQGFIPCRFSFWGQNGGRL